MKKLFNLILIFIFMLTINVKADTICILGECITEGILIKNGDTGSVKGDIVNKTITFDNFNKVISNTSEISTIIIRSYEEKSIIASDIHDYTIIIKGNNSITIDDLNERQFFNMFLGSSYTLNGTDNGKLDIIYNEQTSKSGRTLIGYSSYSSQPVEERVINVNNVEINVEAKDSSLSAYSIVSDNFLNEFNLNNSKINVEIGDNMFTEYFYSNIDFSGIVADNITIIDSEYIFIMKNKAQNQIRGFITKNLYVLRSKINIDFKNNNSELEAISYRREASDSSYIFKDSYFRYHSISGYTFVSQTPNVYIEFDNTELDFLNTNYQGNMIYTVFSTKNDSNPEIIYKNYDEKTLLFKGKDYSNNVITVGINKFSNLKNIGSVNTVNKGKINTEIEDINNIYELTDEDIDNMDIGYDITLSITQEIINPTESVTNLVKDKQILDYFDINFVKEVNENKTNIHELNKEIEISIPLQDSYKKDNITYKVLRIHDNVVDELDTEIKGDFIVFKTDKFSTFVLTYSDTINNPKTGDNLIIYIIISLITLIVFTYFCKTKKIFIKNI